LAGARWSLTGQAQHTGDADGGGAEHVALDRYPVPVTTRHLHNSRISSASQQSADRNTRHVAVCPGPVRRIDRIDIAIENTCSREDFLRIRRIRR
jgi:hypothetical protein